MVAPKSEFGYRLKELFDHAKNGFIAAKLGVAENTVGFYIRGRIPDADMLMTISNVTRCNIHWLLTGKGEKYFRDETVNNRLENRLNDRLKILADEQWRNAFADAEIDGGGSRHATLKLLTDYLLATALVEFKIVDSIRDVMSAADIERAARFEFSRLTIDERLRQMILDVTGEKRTTADSKNESDERIIEPGKVAATIEPGKRRTG